MAKVSRRLKRVSELIRQELGAILIEEVRGPRIGFVTVTRVDVSPDMAQAKVYISVLGEEADSRTTLRGLESARKRIRGRLGERVELRRVPELLFFVDEGMKRGLRVNELLSRLAEERKRTESSPEDEPDMSKGNPEQGENDGL